MRIIALGMVLASAWPQTAGVDQPRELFGKTVDGWIAVVRDKTRTDAQRGQAATMLGYFGADAQAAIPDLRELEREGRLKGAAAKAIARIDRRVEVRLPRAVKDFISQGCAQLTRAGAIGFNPGPRDELVQIGGPAVPELIKILEGQDEDMRVCAAEALALIGPAARGAVLSLIRVVGRRNEALDPDGDPLCRHAIIALGRIGPDAKAARPILKKLFEAKIGYERELVGALAGLGTPPVHELAAQIARDGDLFATDMLRRLGPRAREATPVLREALHDKQPQVRFSAAAAIVWVDRDGNEPIPVLIEALDHCNDKDVAIDVDLAALVQLGARAKAALPKLIELVRAGCDDPAVLEALVQIDSEGAACVQPLVRALESNEWGVVEASAKCLSLLGPRGADAVEALAAVVTRELKSVEPAYFTDPRINAVKALGRIGAIRRKAVPALITALGSHRTVREPGLEKGPNDLDYSLAAAAATVLGSFGNDAARAVPALIKVAQRSEKDDANAEVRHAAIIALGRLGKNAETAIPVLRAMSELGDGESIYAAESIVALYKLAPGNTQIDGRWLDRHLGVQPNMSVFPILEARARVLAATGRASFEGDLTTTRYLRGLEFNLAHTDSPDMDIDFLEDWLGLIGDLGIAARNAVPRLNELCNHPSPWVRMWAREALEKIDPAARAAGRSSVPE